MADKYSTAELIALARKHKVALTIGAGVLLVLAASGGSQSGGGWSGGTDSPVGTDSSGGFDKGAWDNAQARDDRGHGNTIDTIRGVEKCQLPDGSVIEVESGTCNP